MALVIQTEVMVGSYLPYERPPQPSTLWSAIPRGLQSFVVDSQALDSITTPDFALLNMTATLPTNFGYVMADCNLTLAQTSAGVNWIPRYNLNLQNFYRIGIPLSVGLAANWPQDLVNNAFDDSSASSVLEQPWPSFPIIGTPGTSGVQVVISAWNIKGDTAGTGVINAYISFWQFDLEQIRKYPINSPIPTHAR